MYFLELLCALAVACANVEALVTKDVTITEEVVAFDVEKYLVQCGGSNCKVESIETSGGTGLLDLIAEYVEKERGIIKFCTRTEQTSTSIRCGQISLKASYFFISLIPKDKFQNVKLTVKLNNGAIDLKKLRAEGASIQDDGSGGKLVRIRTGHSFTAADYYKLIRVECSGNCGGIEYKLENGQGNTNLAVSQEGLALTHPTGCYSNCLCTSHQAGSKDECQDKDGNTRFDATSNIVYFALIPDLEFSDVEGHFKANNIQSIKIVDLRQNEGKYKLPDGSLVAVVPGPLEKDRHAHFYLKCNDKCRSTSIKIFGEADMFDIRAGAYTILTPGGTCPNCKCLGVTACAATFDPEADHLQITVDTKKLFNGHAYIAVTDPNAKELTFLDGYHELPYYPPFA